MTAFQPRTTWIALWVLTVCAIAVGHAAAQDPWEYTPYRIHLWVRFAPSAELPETLQAGVERQIIDRLDCTVGAPWEVVASTPPRRVAVDLATRLESLTTESFLSSLAVKPPKTAAKPTAAAKSDATTTPNPESAAMEPPTSSPSESTDEKAAETPPVAEVDLRLEDLLKTAADLKQVLRDDKLLVVVVRPAVTGLDVVVREFDCRSRRWGLADKQTVPHLEAVADAVVAATLKTFTPIARLHYAKDKKAVFKLRAAGLSSGEESPVVTTGETIWRPFVRYNDRFGEPRPGGISPVPWTYVVATERTGSKLRCEVESGMSQPLGGKSNSRNERFALFVPPQTNATRLRLRTTDKPPQPMTGFGVYAKNPHGEKGERIDEIGRTDWRGMIDVPPGDFPLRIILVRNGNQLLARLPMVPGLEAEQTVDLTSDDRRLQAEGFLAGVQSSLMDLMAQRELIASRFRRRLEEGKFAEAQKLLADFQTLETREDLERLVNQNQNRITSPHKSVQTKIKKMFDDTRKLITKFIDPDLSVRLANELEAAKSGKPSSPKGASPSTSTPPRPAA